MKKTNLTRSLLAACSIVALSAVMYGCSSSGEDTQRDRATDAEMSLAEALAALEAARAAQATAEAERDAANAAAAAANTARDAALAAQATAESERDAANAAAAAANTARDAAMAAQATAEAAQAAAEAAQMTAEAAQEAAEMAQATAENERDLANIARMAADQARDEAQAARTAAEQAARDAAAGEAAAVARANAADAAAMAAETRATNAEAAAMTAEERARQAEADEAAAMQAQMDAEDARDAAMEAQRTAESARDAAQQAQMTAEGERDTANTRADEAEDARDAAVQAQMDAEGERDAAIKRAEDAEAALKALRDAESTALADARTAASDAATAAQTAADAASDAADAAEMADDNRATIQTGDADSTEHSAEARMHAMAAADAANDAMTASQAAADAEDSDAAESAQDDAEDAQAAAEQAQMDAETAKGMAEADAMAELKIDGTMKSVGDVTVDANAPNNVVTTGTGATMKTVNTGFQADLQEEMAGMQTGQAFAAGTPPAADTPYRQAVAARDINIGKTVDSGDDMARLAIVTHYVGTKNVKVFAYAEADPEATSVADGRTGTRRGYVTLDDTDAETDDTNNTRLRSLGTYYLAGAVGDTDGLSETDEVGTESEGMAVYSYTTAGADGNLGTDDDVTVYLVEDSQRTEGSTTTYVYRSVDIIVAASRPDGPDDGDVADDGEVTAMIAEATAYKHIHFGVWAGLDEDGNDPSGHGIGFVQNIVDGGSMTAVMPNFGGATFDGNWVATVQAADPDGDGDISLADGVAELTADFVDDEVTVNLMGLAMLEGDISGNTFSGTKATVGDDNMHSLTGDADFEGAFSGAFFGVGAAEAGGVFSFGSDDDNEDGAFAGAFGGAR